MGPHFRQNSASTAVRHSAIAKGLYCKPEQQLSTGHPKPTFAGEHSVRDLTAVHDRQRARRPSQLLAQDQSAQRGASRFAGHCTLALWLFQPAGGSACSCSCSRDALTHLVTPSLACRRTSPSRDTESSTPLLANLTVCKQAGLDRCKLHRYVGPGAEDSDAASVRTTTPVKEQGPFFFFEVTVVNKGQQGFIGAACVQPADSCPLPG